MDLLLKKCPHHLSPEMLALYHDANWTNYTRKPDRLAKAYEHSLAIYGAYEKRHLVGLIRVVGDGHSLVVVQDLIVLKSHHRKGIGSALLQLVLDTYKGCYHIQLLTESSPKTLAFYQAFGLVPVHQLGCTAFILQS
ncbi:GNAT family N-acetyltransferase [Streptococcus iniae]|uniref:GNAT family N-acetyltransferase n=1 Tax=Streptococcus iniae TaxID=1346 RepID=A0A3L8GQ53_STRIN|nr:GNAT family N-acetyltransferase [Streptococcus iniae]AGM97972.1 acetyltransferase, gnat family [Streptococcus iniae SF1]AHY15055.1 GNAT family acetyltransferase [Streptococcus iniae]AHY16926.1 GNAT family acetyltransferase [Streptococcus iniae]AJG25212.1 GNAT family acetyltransferase [Streptococcus iniae]APD31114.1 GNAT family N-acetyltransferase [Streptococcus iniae]